MDLHYNRYLTSLTGSLTRTGSVNAASLCALCPRGWSAVGTFPSDLHVALRREYTRSLRRFDIWAWKLILHFRCRQKRTYDGGYGNRFAAASMYGDRLMGELCDRLLGDSCHATDYWVILVMRQIIG